MSAENIWCQQLHFIVETIFKERKMDLTREHYCGNIVNDFKVEQNQEQCLQRLQLAYEIEAPSCTALYSN